MAKRLISLATAIVLGAILLAASASVALSKKDPPSRPIDPNIANVRELEELPGVGAVTAQAIINFRQKSGPYHRVEDLLVIRGISPRKLDRMRPYLRIGSAPGTPKPAAKPPVKPPTKPAPKPTVPAGKPVPATATKPASTPPKPTSPGTKPGATVQNKLTTASQPQPAH